MRGYYIEEEYRIAYWVIPYIDMVLAAINYKYGHWLDYPFGGGVLDQPYKTFEIFKLIQTKYMELLDEKMSKVK